MEVILLEKVNKLGVTGDIVTVKPGFGRNFLVAQGKALRATDENKKLYQERKKELEAENKKKIEEARKYVSQIDGKFIVQIRQAGEDGRLFGSVTVKDVADEIHAQTKIIVAKSQIEIKGAIKALGVYEAEIFLHPEVSAKIMINVARSVDEADEAKRSFLNPQEVKSEN